jgi:hypothetical protein
MARDPTPQEFIAAAKSAIAFALDLKHDANTTGTELCFDERVALHSS